MELGKVRHWVGHSLMLPLAWHLSGGRSTCWALHTPRTCLISATHLVALMISLLFVLSTPISQDIAVLALQSLMLSW